MVINKLLNRMLPLSLRGGALASKFLLIIYISHYYELSNLGEYALVVAGVSYFGYLLGFDFYTYSSRKIVGATKTEQAVYLKNQFCVYFILYFITIVLMFLFITLYPALSKLALIFVLLMILEHCAQEIMRLLVIFEHPLIANIQFFIRNALWIYSYILYSLFVKKLPFNYLWYLWISAEVISLFFFVIILRKIKFSKLVKSNFDLEWIFKGIRICFPLLISTLSLRGIFTADRYILSYYDSKEIVGIYSYFSSFSSSIMAFVDAGVVMIYYPRLIKFANERKISDFNITKAKFLSSLVITSTLIAGTLIVAVPFLSSMTGKADFLNSISLLYVMLLSSFIYCISLAYHFELYAKNLDSYIIKSSIIAFVVSVLLMVLLGYFYAAIGIAIAQLIGIVILFLSKYRYCKIGQYD